MDNFAAAIKKSQAANFSVILKDRKAEQSLSEHGISILMGNEERTVDQTFTL